MCEIIFYDELVGEMIMLVFLIVPKDNMLIP